MPEIGGSKLPSTSAQQLHTKQPHMKQPHDVKQRKSFAPCAEVSVLLKTLLQDIMCYFVWDVLIAIASQSAVEDHFPSPFRLCTNELTSRVVLCCVVKLCRVFLYNLNT